MMTQLIWKDILAKRWRKIIFRLSWWLGFLEKICKTHFVIPHCSQSQLELNYYLFLHFFTSSTILPVFLKLCIFKCNNYNAMVKIVYLSEKKMSSLLRTHTTTNNKKSTRNYCYYLCMYITYWMYLLRILWSNKLQNIFKEPVHKLASQSQRRVFKNGAYNPYK